MHRYLRLLRNRPFTFLWTGSTISSLGDSMTFVAMVWLVFERGGSRSVAALVVVSTAPVIAGGFVMGMALDRFDRRRVLMAVNLTLGIAVALVPLWGRLGGEAPTWLLFSVAALYGLLKMANWAGVPSLIPALVAEADLNTANAMESASFAIADVAGPAVAGALIGFIGAQNVLAVDAATYLIFLACLVGLRGKLPETVVAPSPEGRAPISLRPAFAFLRRTPAVFATTLMFMSFNVGEGMLLVLLPTYTHTVLTAGPRTYGAMLSVFSFAALAGSVIAGAIEWRPPLGRSIAAAQALTGIALLGLALRLGLAATAVTLALVGMLASPLTIWAQTIRMRLVPEDLRGRIFGVLRTLMQSTPPVGGAIAGVLLGGPGVALTVVLMSAFVAVPGIAGLFTPALADREVAGARALPET